MKTSGALIMSFLLAAVLLCLAGCGGNVYHDVFNGEEQSPNVRSFKASGDDCYAAAKRAVLFQSFRIEKEDPQWKSFVAARYFESGKDSTVLTINVGVMEGGKGEATMYVTAVQHQDIVRVTTDRALLGLLPVGSSATKTKQNEQTIVEKEFYDRFFAAVQKEMGK